MDDTNMTTTIDKSKPVAVIGAGTMGRGIVQVFAQSGFEVRMFDAVPAALEAAPGMIGKLGSVRSPSTTCRSVRQTPQAEIATCSWPGPGLGSGRCTSLSGVPGCTRTIAFTWGAPRSSRCET